jgi:hypothetical protein
MATAYGDRVVHMRSRGKNHKGVRDLVPQTCVYREDEANPLRLTRYCNLDAHITSAAHTLVQQKSSTKYEGRLDTTYCDIGLWTWLPGLRICLCYQRALNVGEDGSRGQYMRRE